VLAALAGGASGSPSDEATGVAVEGAGAGDADLAVVLIETWEAWADGYFSDSDGSRNSVGILKTCDTHFGCTGASIGTSRGDRLVVPIELIRSRKTTVCICISRLGNCRVDSITRADLDDVGKGCITIKEEKLDPIDACRCRINSVDIVAGTGNVVRVVSNKRYS
jgi:hypothetical protein